MKKIDYFLLFAVLAAIAVGLFVVLTPSGEINQLKDELDKKKQTQIKLQQETKEAEQQIDRLRNNDPAAIETIARDKFGYCRPGEEVYQLEVIQEGQK